MTKKASVLAYNFPVESKISIETALADHCDLIFQHDPAIFQTEIDTHHYDIILMNHQPENGKNVSLLHKVQEQIPFTPVIITCQANDSVHVDKQLEPIIYSILNFPLVPDRVRLTAKQALNKRRQDNELAYLRRTQDIIYSFDRIIAESNNFKTVVKNLKKFAATDTTMLITGDTGTGKSFLSGTIHYNSLRRNHPFIKINCANIPETLIESELFGHEKGAFTGADKQRIGRFEQADGGTIFLDEIGEIPLTVQAKLLRVLEDTAFERVGGNKTIKVNVRLITATNKDLPALIAAGVFREDLYYRINILPIHLPPLRERSNCLVPLAKNLLQKLTVSLKKGNITDFTPEALAMIQGYHWPGNIRQLANTIERAVILEDSNLIGLTSIDIPELNMGAAQMTQPAEPLEDHERALIIKALAENLWVQKDAARFLGISPRALNYKIKKFNITHQQWRTHKK
jgi:Response regulator containing CheY-like receiver, AAA-type ATPase, and DNA-binding domains